MSIVVVCSGCGSKSAAPDRAAGTRGKCPKCGTVIQVPAAASATAAPRPAAAATRPAVSAGAAAAARPAPARAAPAIPAASASPFDTGIDADEASPFDVAGASAEASPFDAGMIDVAAIPAAHSSAPAPAANMPIPAGTIGFKRIGITFHYCRRSFYGDVIASENALYLVLSRVRSDVGTAAAGVAGGAIGGLIAGAVGGMLASSAAEKLDPRRIIKAGRLPPDVRQHPTWPAKKLKDDVDVVVIPKHEIASPGVVHPKWGNLLKLQIDGNPVMIEYAAFRGGGVKAFLESGGWSLAWGQNIRFANPDGTVPRSNFHKKVLYLAAGVVLAFGITVGAVHYFGLTAPKEAPKHILSAAAEGDLETLKQHHAAGTDKAEKDAAFRAAVESNQMAAARLLLEYGANPNAAVPSGESPVYFSAKNGNAEMLNFLLEHGAPVNAPDPQGMLPIHAAAMQGHTECVKALLDHGQDVNAVATDYKLTPLMMAAKMQSPQCLQTAKLLIGRGGDKLIKDSRGGLAWGWFMGNKQNRAAMPEDAEMEKLLDYPPPARP